MSKPEDREMDIDAPDAEDTTCARCGNGCAGNVSESYKTTLTATAKGYRWQHIDAICFPCVRAMRRLERRRKRRCGFRR